MRKTQPKTTPRKAEPKPAAVQPISAPAEIEAPYWVNVTPESPQFGLGMWDGGDEMQYLNLDREEFIILKRLLAAHAAKTYRMPHRAR